MIFEQLFLLTSLVRRLCVQSSAVKYTVEFSEIYSGVQWNGKILNQEISQNIRGVLQWLLGSFIGYLSGKYDDRLYILTFMSLAWLVNNWCYVFTHVILRACLVWYCSMLVWTCCYLSVLKWVLSNHSVLKQYALIWVYWLRCLFYSADKFVSNLFIQNAQLVSISIRFNQLSTGLANSS